MPVPIPVPEIDAGSLSAAISIVAGSLSLLHEKVRKLREKGEPSRAEESREKQDEE